MIKYNKGDILGELIFKEDLPRNGKPRRAIFECPLCNKDFEVYIHNAKGLNVTKCKSCWDKIKCEDITGLVSSKLTVIDRAGKDRYGKSVWNCICKCGNTTIAKESFLKLGYIKSCGCLIIEHARDLNNIYSKTHGMCGTAFYIVWQNMKNRCYDKNSTAYHRYGGRGIKVCERWIGEDGFKNFYEDMFSTYQEELEIDRKNNDGNYELSNCRWVTREVNMQNTSNTKLNTKEVIYIRNSNKHYKEIAKELNVSESCIKSVLQNKSWKNINQN